MSDIHIIVFNDRMVKSFFFTTWTRKNALSPVPTEQAHVSSTICQNELEETQLRFTGGGGGISPVSNQEARPF